MENIIMEMCDMLMSMGLDPTVNGSTITCNTPEGFIFHFKLLDMELNSYYRYVLLSDLQIKGDDETIHEELLSFANDVNCKSCGATCSIDGGDIWFRITTPLCENFDVTNVIDFTFIRLMKAKEDFIEAMMKKVLSLRSEINDIHTATAVLKMSNSGKES